MNPLKFVVMASAVWCALIATAAAFYVIAQVAAWVSSAPRRRPADLAGLIPGTIRIEKHRDQIQPIQKLKK